MRPAEGAVYFDNSPVENMKQMKTTTATKSWNVCALSYHFTRFLYISTAHQAVSLVTAEPLWHSNTNRHSLFHLLLHCGGFVAGKGSDTELYCLTLWWISTTCATRLIYMDSSSTAARMLAQSLSPARANTVEICPRPASHESALITASESLTVLQRSNPHSALNKGWRLHLLASLLCRGIRQGVEAALWNPGILASQSSSSGRRTARWGRETWLKWERQAGPMTKKGSAHCNSVKHIDH